MSLEPDPKTPGAFMVEMGANAALEWLRHLYPQAARFIHIEGDDVRMYAEHSLHRDDLDFASQCLEAFRPMVAQSDTPVARALWSSAVVALLKCFKRSAARKAKLDPTVIFATEPLGLDALKFFEQLRDKHVVHDDNAVHQPIPAAVINPAGSAQKVLRVDCIKARAQVLDLENFNNLWSLVHMTRAWVIAECGRLQAIIEARLECQSHGDLLAAPEVRPYSMLEPGYMGRNRSAP
jgi:hypothetical protein